MRVEGGVGCAGWMECEGEVVYHVLGFLGDEGCCASAIARVDVFLDETHFVCWFVKQ